MNISKQIAKHFREVYFGGNWTCVNLKDQLQDVNWQEAVTQVYSLNTIATLTNHIHYYVKAVLKVLQGEALNAKDIDSFEHPTIQAQMDWDEFLTNAWSDAEQFAALIEKLPDETLGELFTDPKYGIYFRNLIGIIEHTHYHLGQIAIIKKIVRQSR
ncbi:MAG: DUF1572 domain-containing protein [Saprospiraceae bacterium]|nr:DUF1572 domain-containing protein [Saprospiraceae bacterium]HRG67809.1 DUF1572 domain-containing protein [Saprospiraceae bacterium]